MTSVLYVKPEVYREILDFLRQNRKIQAIKLLRTEVGCGLKEAKYAIDRLMCERSEFVEYQGEAPAGAPVLTSLPKIVEVTLDYGTGPVKVSLETMEMTVLSQLHTIGLDAVADALDVVEALQAINSGRKVRVVEEEEE